MKKKSPFTELLRNEKLSKESYLFNIEHSRVTEDIIFLKFEVFSYQKKSVFKLKLQIDINDNLKNIPVGKSISKVGLVSLSNRNFIQMFKDGVGNAVGDGRIPFFPGIWNRNNKNYIQGKWERLDKEIDQLACLPVGRFISFTA